MAYLFDTKNVTRKLQRLQQRSPIVHNSGDKWLVGRNKIGSSISSSSIHGGGMIALRRATSLQRRTMVGLHEWTPDFANVATDRRYECPDVAVGSDDASRMRRAHFPPARPTETSNIPSARLLRSDAPFLGHYAALQLGKFIWQICVAFVSASEMTYIVSGGALNSTHSRVACES